MTKEEIAKIYVPCRCDVAYASRGLSAPDCPYHSTDPEMAMEEWAKQQAIEFMKFVDAFYSQQVSSVEYDKMYVQFIEQQTENK